MAVLVFFKNQKNLKIHSCETHSNADISNIFIIVCICT